jgi:hypothetical protein
MLKENKVTRRYILILTAFLAAILLLALSINNPLTASAEGSRRQSQSEVVQAQYLSISPAQALSNSKPTVFFFYPFDACRIRYCQHPSQVAGQVKENFGDQVNFVAVGINTMTYGPDPNASASHYLATWDAYPVEAYAEWLPEDIYQATEDALPKPKTVLVDSAGKLVFEGSEFTPWVQLEPNIERLLGN